MARIRTIKPEFWTSEQVVECSRDARLLFVGMWNFADDHGIHEGSCKQLKMRVFPGDDCSIDQIAGWVDELKRNGLIHEYVVENKTYWMVTGWHHQKIEKPSYKHPLPENRKPVADHSPNGSGEVGDGQPPEGNGKEGKGEEGKSNPASDDATPPRNKRKTSMPEDFVISDRVKAWAAKKGYADLDAHLETFRSKAIAKNYQYVDWDEAFMGAIREDWAKLRMPQAPPGQHGAALDPRQAENKPHVQPFPQRARS